jgi:hypothetical protein
MSRVLQIPKERLYFDNMFEEKMKKERKANLM